MADPSDDIFADLPRVPEREVADAAALDAMLQTADRPFVVRGLVADWPLVQAGLRSAKDARRYLLDHRRDRPFTVSVGAGGGDGRLFYDDAMAMNFATVQTRLDEVFAHLDVNENAPDLRPIYFASIDVLGYFDGLHEANHVDLGDRAPLASIWMGTRTRIAAHNDVPDNLACVAVGRRRFTLFPREQFRNLYLGPIDNTPAGRAVSMVDFHAPDFDAHPRFRDALEHAQVAELDAGDALYVPAMWWHHVEGLAAFNILVNYWWRTAAPWMGQPQDALNHAILAVRDLPEDQKRHWRDMFDHYVFDNDDSVTAHIPGPARSILDRLTPESAGRLRAFLLRSLSR
ncbi:Cupin-like domain-containing protein [Sphingomonas gellani]|uniref:Cupin-like domain-containing protein n=1 Tax=Sphingomonas gellani TaxID=1166340 RepID=A0A1H8GMY8_9SPHN|nr:cupin-like domain-containing protein [Sphingomonas gellani]SEN45511.1 Cupin-like domain-containing protein [Sphingomonas gellani]